MLFTLILRYCLYSIFQLVLKTPEIPDIYRVLLKEIKHLYLYFMQNKI